MEDWGFRIAIGFFVLLIVGFFTGIISLAIHTDNANTAEFKRDCVALGGNPEIGREKLCLKDSRVIFRR